MTLLAQISDLHLDGSARATERATRVVDHLRALPRPVDALLVTGDIADHGTPSEYEEAAALLAAVPYPVLLCPGNHDAREPYRKVLLGEPESGGPVNRAHDIGGTRILMCDSSIPGRPDGLLEAETLRWVADSLDPGTPALLAFHHPPVTLHHPYVDGIMLRQPEGLAELLAAHPQVAAVITGHAHTAAATTFAGRPLVVGPGVTSTSSMPWESDEVVDLSAPPGFAFHVLDEDARLTTHYRVV